jgi:hypothetical protein
MNKAGTTVPCGKIKLMLTAETVSVPHRGEAGTHGRESAIGFFDESRIIFEMDAVLADRPGATQLN